MGLNVLPENKKSKIKMIEKKMSRAEVKISTPYTVCQENRYFVKNMLLLKNPQFLSNHYKTLAK